MFPCVLKHFYYDETTRFSVLPRYVLKMYAEITSEAVHFLKLWSDRVTDKKN